MVGLDGFSKVPNVNTHSDEVLPDLPVFIVTLQSFLQGAKSFVSADNRNENKNQKRVNAAISLSVFTVIIIPTFGGGLVD